MADITLGQPTAMTGAGLVQAVAGEAISGSSPQAVAIGADGKVYKASASDAQKSKVVGLCIGGAAGDGAPCVYAPNGATLTVTGTTAGAVYYASDNAHASGSNGGVCPEADLLTGEYVTVVGYGTGSKFVVDIIQTGVQKP